MLNLKIFLCDNGVYTKEHFKTSVVDMLKQIACEHGFSAEVMIEQGAGTYSVHAPEGAEEQAALFEKMLAGISDDIDAGEFLHRRIIRRLSALGVDFIDGGNTYIDNTAEIAAGVRIYPNVYIEGNVKIGEGTVLYPGCRIEDSVIGKNCVLEQVRAREASIGDSVSIGPYVNLRPGTVIADGCRIGDFVEVKNSKIGSGTKLPHLSYIGDADVGERVNVGCGTVFVNYDGKNKHRTRVGNDVFIGCNTNLIAPVSVADGAYTAAGSTITDDVPEKTLAIARARQVNKAGWVAPKERE